MVELQIPVKRTVITMRDYVRAVMKAWHVVDDGPCTKGACAVLWAQHMIETGGAACWNFNIGNVKHVPGDGFDYVCLNGVWEGVSPVVAANLIADGRAVRDPSPNHAAAVGAGRVSVIFPPPQPESRFRAFPSLDVAMVAHLKLLAHRFALCWPWVIAGDYVKFAHALKAGPDGRENTRDDYFTAAADAYAAGMRRPYEEAMSSSAWNNVLDEMDAETQPEIDNPASRPTLFPLPATVHADPTLYRLDVDPDDDAA